MAEADLPVEHHRATATVELGQGGDQHDRSHREDQQTGEGAIQIAESHQDHHRLSAAGRCAKFAAIKPFCLFN